MFLRNLVGVLVEQLSGFHLGKGAIGFVEEIITTSPTQSRLS
jgi:hypothetical protein